MGRTTVKDLQNIIDELNEVIHDSKVKVILGQRNGYKALDLYSADGKNMQRTIVSGLLAGQVWDYVRAMLDGIELYRRATPMTKQIQSESELTEKEKMIETIMSDYEENEYNSRETIWGLAREALEKLSLNELKDRFPEN